MRLVAGRQRWAAVAVTTALAAALAGAPSASSAGSRGGSAADAAQVVVRAVPGHVADAVAAVRAVGGTVSRDLPIVDGVAASVPAGALVSLSRSPGIAAVTPDAAVQLADASYGGAALASSYPESSGASQAWTEGNAGAGVTVAVLDTGVSPVPGLSGRVMAGPDLSGEGSSTQDSYGHGTVMAGIIAGDGAGSQDVDGGSWVGMAPQARVLSVKVAGRQGATDVSTVLAALQWIASSADTYGIRVLNLSWGTPSTQSAVVDPLNYAVQRVWARGVVVVVASGNAGPTAGTVSKPGDDPLVITVGAYDEAGNAAPADDQVTDWSSRGPTVDGLRKPDLVAPGRTLVSPVEPRSLVAEQNPDAMVAPGYIKGSGSSHAAAVTSGAAALLLSARPELSPDQVKAALRSTAVRLDGTIGRAQGRGRLSVTAAMTAPASTSVQTAWATGTGSLEASRGGRHVVTTCPGETTPRVISGEVDALCRPWSGDSWSGDSWSADSWSADSWSADSWSADSWSADSWSADSWSADSWSADSWSADSWSADSWSADSWTSAFWGEATPASRPLPGEPVKGKEGEGPR